MFEDNKRNLYTREELLKLGIYELRELGRDVGVQSPTTLKKADLVDAIIMVLYGKAPKRTIGKGRGRPARNSDKPCKLFLDLIERIEQPKETGLLYDEESPSFDYEQLSYAKVASPKAIYRVDEESKFVIRRGVVCVEQDNTYIRKLKFVASEQDVVVPDSIVDDYGLRDNDIVEYFTDKEGTSVEQIIKINGNLASKKDLKDRKRYESQRVDLDARHFVITNQSNIIYAQTQDEREKLCEDTAQKFLDDGYSVVEVCFDKNYDEKINFEKGKLAAFFATSPGDEYETIAMAEMAVERAKFYDNLNDKVCLVIDNLSWLIQVIDSYPKSLYGNFLAKLARLSQGINSNITVICITGVLEREKARVLAGLFHNVMM